MLMRDPLWAQGAPGGKVATSALTKIHQPYMLTPKQALDWHIFKAECGPTYAGSTGWKEFPEFKERVIKPSKTRVLAFLNIVGAGMGTGNDDLLEMSHGGAVVSCATTDPSPWTAAGVFAALYVRAIA